MAETVALVDYGAGNLHSVQNALKAAGAERIAVTADPIAIRDADRIILPGVGAFGAAMRALEAIPGMIEALDDAVLMKGRPFLGVCVGMQLLAHWGEEGERVPGLCWVEGTVRAIQPANGVRVPHMGWNDVRPVDGQGLIQAGEAYFLHGYALETEDKWVIAAFTDHGGQRIAAVEQNNIVGVQFHPEKSQRYGLELLRRFLDWRP